MKTGGKQVFNDINITPLTDIFLVLLIIMMVVAPMMQEQRQDIKPPSIKAGSQIGQGKLTLEITQKGDLYLQGKETPIANLTSALQNEETALAAKSGGSMAVAESGADSPETTTKHQEKTLVIRADKKTKSGQVLKIFDAARDAGFQKIIVAGEALEEKRQNELENSPSAPPPEEGN
jgi:biopolymer transport protein ExbD